VAKSVPIFGGAAGELITLAAAIGETMTVRNNVRSAVKTGWISLFKDNSNYDKRIELGDAVMIGVVHDRGFFIKHGAPLKKSTELHSNYKKSADGKEPIYTVADLKGAIEADQAGSKTQKEPAWYVKAHDDLTSHYVAVQNKIETQPWYYTFPMFWKDMGLRSAMQDVLKADALIASSKQGSAFLKADYDRHNNKHGTFEQAFGGGKDSLVEVMKSQKGCKQLLGAVIANEQSDEKNDKIMLVKKLIEQVESKEIAVSPDTFYRCVKFTHEMRRLCHDKQGADAFIEKNGKLDVIPEANQTFSEAFAKNQQVAVLPSKERQSTGVQGALKEVAIGVLQCLMDEKDGYKAIAGSADLAANLAGNAAGGATFKAMAGSGALLGKAVNCATGGVTVLGKNNQMLTQAYGAVPAAAAYLGMGSAMGVGYKAVETVVGVVVAYPVLVTVAGLGLWNAKYLSALAQSTFSLVQSVVAPVSANRKPTVVVKDINSACDLAANTKDIGNLTPGIKESKVDISNKAVVDQLPFDSHLEGEKGVDLKPGHQHYAAALGAGPTQSIKAGVREVADKHIQDEVKEERISEALKGSSKEKGM
jgi:hypothetical protein